MPSVYTWLSYPGEGRRLDEALHLNVGGTLHATTVATLQREPSSCLARLAVHHLKKPNRLDLPSMPMLYAGTMLGLDGSPTLFIDRDGELFRHVLAYLRNGCELQAPADLATTCALLQEARVYGLPGMEEQLVQHYRALRAASEDTSYTAADVWRLRG